MTPMRSNRSLLAEGMVGRDMGAEAGWERSLQDNRFLGRDTRELVGIGRPSRAAGGGRKVEFAQAWRSHL